MQKNSITNKITPCCGLPFSVIYWWVSNLTLNSEADRQFIISKISQGGIISIDAWKILINSGVLEADASLTKAQFLAWFDCGRQPNCEQLKMIIEGLKIGNYNPADEYGVGWTEVVEMEIFGDKLIKKIINYVGGVGAMPTELSDRIGKYYGNGIFTTDQNLAVDFKADVLSNYDLAVANGFVGTLSEYLISLEGADGENKIEKWVAGNYTSGQQVITDDGWFGVRDGMNALPTDIPSEDSLVWEVIFDGASKEVDTVLKYFLENKSFAIQDETTYSDFSNVRTFVLDNSLRNISNIYVKGNSDYNNFIIGKRENNTTIKLLGTNDTVLYDQNFGGDFSQYKEIEVNFFIAVGWDQNPIVKSTRTSKNPPIEDAIKEYTDTEILPIKQAIGAFKNGSDILTIPNVEFNIGFIKPDKTTYNSSYGFWSEIPLK